LRSQWAGVPLAATTRQRRDRDIGHKVNIFSHAELPQRLLLNVRIQGRTAQPITTSPRVLNGVDRGRNWDRINPLSTPALFNFDGFLREGVGDPLQLQIAAKVTF
jgi:hypothetical protein